MTPLHQRPFTLADREIYATLGRSLAIGGMTEVYLDKGLAYAQMMSNRCAAAAVWNALETYDDRYELPEGTNWPNVGQIYTLAREIDDFADHDTGTSIEAAAEAACRLIGRGLRWMSLPLDAEILAAWLATERTGVVYGTQWTLGHQTPRKRVLVPTNELVAPGHAVHLHGFKAEHSYRPWLFGRRRTGPVFVVENSHSHPELDFYLPAAGVALHGIAAVVFIPPNY